LIANHVVEMSRLNGSQVYKFGLDATGKICYKFNSQGFRSEVDFDVVPKYAFFGCSMVLGIGVPVDQTFAYMFENSQNYGIAGNYNNFDVFSLVKKFLDSSTHTKNTKIAVIWHARDSDNLESYYEQLTPHKILHFFCGEPLPYELCYPVLPNIDYDVSNTHYGPKSHRAFWRLLSSLFDQS